MTKFACCRILHGATVGKWNAFEYSRKSLRHSDVLYGLVVKRVEIEKSCARQNRT